MSGIGDYVSFSISTLRRSEDDGVTTVSQILSTKILYVVIIVGLSINICRWASRLPYILASSGYLRDDGIYAAANIAVICLCVMAWYYPKITMRKIYNNRNRIFAGWMFVVLVFWGILVDFPYFLEGMRTGGGAMLPVLTIFLKVFVVSYLIVKIRQARRALSELPERYVLCCMSNGCSLEGVMQEIRSIISSKELVAYFKYWFSDLDPSDVIVFLKGYRTGDPKYVAVDRALLRVAGPDSME
ncbi:MAG TPA: hypothetical protein VK196_02665 [Magnetospirillum sp.]|nr:hypothetical protein [Magnetospirillum sp.]